MKNSRIWAHFHKEKFQKREVSKLGIEERKKNISIQRKTNNQ